MGFILKGIESRPRWALVSSPWHTNLFHPQRNWKSKKRDLNSRVLAPKVSSSKELKVEIIKQLFGDSWRCFILKGIESNSFTHFSTMIPEKFHPQRNWKLFFFDPTYITQQGVSSSKELKARNNGDLSSALSTSLFHPQRNWKIEPSHQRRIERAVSSSKELKV